MSEDKIADQKIYLMITITTEEARDFNDLWIKESLPYWLKFGAKHIGSFVNWIGGPICSDDEIIRIFEFENVDHYCRWDNWLHSNEDGEVLRKKLGKYKHKSQRRLLSTAPILK